MKNLPSNAQKEKLKKEKTISKKIRALKKTGEFVLYLIILFSLIYAVPQALSWVLKTNYPMASISSGSMWPTLKKGDLVFIKGVEGKEEIETGDIVVYKNIKGFTIHRVVELHNNTLVTRGDANTKNDSPVQYDEVIGKVILWGEKPFKAPLLGNISLIMNKQ